MYSRLRDSLARVDAVPAWLLGVDNDAGTRVGRLRNQPDIKWGFPFFRLDSGRVLVGPGIKPQTHVFWLDPASKVLGSDSKTHLESRWCTMLID